MAKVQISSCGGMPMEERNADIVICDSDVEEGEVLEADGEDAAQATNNFVFRIQFGSQTYAEQYLPRVTKLLEVFVSKEPLEFKFNSEDASICVIESDPVDDINSLFIVDTAPSAKLETDAVPSYKRTIKDVLDEVEKKDVATEDVCKRPRISASCFNCGESGHSLRECNKPRNLNRINRAKKQHTSSKTTERYHVDKEQKYGHLRPGVISQGLRQALGIKSGELPFFFYRMRVLGYPPGWYEESKTRSSGIALINADGTEVNSAGQNGGDPNQDKIDVTKIIDFPGFNADPGKKFYDDHKFHRVPPYDVNQSKQMFIESLGDNAVKGYKRKKLKKLPAAHNGEEFDQSMPDDNCIIGDMEIDDDVVEILDTSAVSTITIEDDGFGEEDTNVEKTEDGVNDISTCEETIKSSEDGDTSVVEVESAIEESSHQNETMKQVEVNETEEEEKKDKQKKGEEALNELDEQLSVELESKNGAQVTKAEPQSNEKEASEGEIEAENTTDAEPQDKWESGNKPAPAVSEETAHFEHADTNSEHQQIEDKGNEDAAGQPEANTNIITDELINQPVDSQRTDPVFLETHVGTPILKFSPYDQLPDQGNFKVGVSDVIYFDNLPDATGKYDQMKQVLKNVRKKINKIRQEEDEDD